MDEEDILQRIEKLVEQEQSLRENAGADSQDQLRRLEVALDQCWDLLRQRRALRDAGQDPDDAAVRPPDEVEGYRQ